MRSGLLHGLRASALVAMGLGAVPASAAVDHSTLAGGVEGIYITGEIVPGDEATFRGLAERYRTAVVYLESPGGTVLPAIEIGKLVRERGYKTVVLADSTCTSACALIWLGGKHRYLEPGGHLGFHATHSDQGGRMVETGVGNAMVGHYLSQLNLPEKAVVFATIASPYELNWLNAENSSEAGIAFETAVQSLPAPDRAYFDPARPLEKARATPHSIASGAPPAKTAEPDRPQPEPYLQKGATSSRP